MTFYFRCKCCNRTFSGTPDQKELKCEYVHCTRRGSVVFILGGKYLAFNCEFVQKM